MVRHRRRRIGKKLLLLSLAALLFGGMGVASCRERETELPVLQPLEMASTDRAVCFVTLSLTGVETDAALQLFASVCEGMGISPCIFVTTAWLESHTDYLPLLSFAELGLLVPENLQSHTKKRTFSMLASENERFLALTGCFPRYVRLEQGVPNRLLSAALRSYGQLCIGSGGTLSDRPTPGGIVDCGLLNGTTGYLLAKFCASAVATEYTVLPLSALQKLL